jgi:hypothetical protein
MNLVERVARLNKMVADNRILRGAWTDGHERACLLAALSPEAGCQESASACPSWVMPEWLAHLTPWIDDECSHDNWDKIVGKYANLAGRWHVLDDAAWDRCHLATRRAILAEAMQHNEQRKVSSACAAAMAWLDSPDAARRSDLLESVRKIYFLFDESGEEYAVCTQVARAAWAVLEPLSYSDQASSAADLAVTAAQFKVWNDGRGARPNASKAAADRIIFNIFEVMETEISKKEG